MLTAINQSDRNLRATITSNQVNLRAEYFIISHTRLCRCDLACEDNRYKFSLSASVWPSNKVNTL